MQDSSGGTKSEQVWFTLRRTLLQMVSFSDCQLYVEKRLMRMLVLMQDRHDLADMAKAGTDVEVFRKEGFDF